MKQRQRNKKLKKSGDVWAGTIGNTESYERFDLDYNYLKSKANINSYTIVKVDKKRKTITIK